MHNPADYRAKDKFCLRFYKQHKRLPTLVEIDVWHKELHNTKVVPITKVPVKPSKKGRK
jgi:hypothetical protein